MAFLKVILSADTTVCNRNATVEGRWVESQVLMFHFCCVFEMSPAIPFPFYSFSFILLREVVDHEDVPFSSLDIKFNENYW